MAAVDGLYLRDGFIAEVGIDPLHDLGPLVLETCGIGAAIDFNMKRAVVLFTWWEGELDGQYDGGELVSCDGVPIG